jgi:hypothetical protein
MKKGHAIKLNSAENIFIINNVFGLDKNCDQILTNFIGILLDQECSKNTIEKNVICGSVNGIITSLNCKNNLIKNNFIGINKSDNKPKPNITAVVLESYNIFENNTLSGNIAPMLILGDENKISNNMFGVDSTGKHPIVIHKPIAFGSESKNNIFENNIVNSNNHALQLSGKSVRNNYIRYNKIGCDIDGEQC